jgi:phosphatidylserine decarboxylase
MLLGTASFLLLGFSCVLLAEMHGRWLFLLLIPLALALAWLFWFFRDPVRTVPAGPGLIVSPADGVVTHLDLAEEPDFIGGEAQRCSIFLSIFDVHLNRAPLAGEAVYSRFRKGEFHDARSAEALEENQNHDLGIIPSEPGMPEKALVRQSAGAIARRIVCPVEIGSALARGERYGMIKFGSRTTLMLSGGAGVEWLVKKGEKVKAGETALARVVAVSRKDADASK